MSNVRNVIVGGVIMFVVGASVITPKKSFSNTHNQNSLQVEKIDCGSVPLDEIEPPVFSKEFFKVDGTGVMWGEGEIWIDKQSGFPGFGYPMLVINYETSANKVKVETTYGTYYYKLKKTSPAYTVDGVLVNNKGEKLVQFLEKEELLYIMNENKVRIYALMTGTEITKGELK